MATYLVESPHTPDECLQTLDEVLAHGSDMLSKYAWGCGAGVHTGWITVDAVSEAEAAKTVPAFIRSKAHVVQTNTFSPEQVKSFHQK